MKNLIIQKVKKEVEKCYGIQLDKSEITVEIPPDSKLGDYSVPMFLLSKQLKKSPLSIAEEVSLTINGISEEWIDYTQEVGGYVNFYLSRKYMTTKVLADATELNYGGSNEGHGKTICMDYSSPNIAKNFHVGHLRTTIIGNSLFKIFSKLGYSVVRINHLGDWGTQFGKLIVAYKMWSSKENVMQRGIQELMEIYIKFEKEAEVNPQLYEEARAWFVKMEQGDEEALSIWKWFKEISLIEYERVYKMLNVEFDSYQGESFYMDQVPALAMELKEMNLLQESNGAYIVSLEEYGMPPCLITKQNGSSIYHSRDIAAAIYRKNTYNFDQCLYITGMEQKLHFAQVFKTIELMGYEWGKDCHHIPYGLVSMGGEKLSTRKGNIVYAEEILKEATLRALSAICAKNPELKDKEHIAKQIGVGAVVFHDLSNQLVKDIQFNWEEVLNFDGMTAPYIQYTVARANSILKKVEVSGEIQYSAEYLTEDICYEIMKYLNRYPEVIIEAAEKYEPCIIAKYAYNMAVMYNKFYQECRILNAEYEVKKSRLVLTSIVKKTIVDAMDLLGIECPEEM